MSNQGTKTRITVVYLFPIQTSRSTTTFTPFAKRRALQCHKICLVCFESKYCDWLKTNFFAFWIVKQVCYCRKQRSNFFRKALVLLIFSVFKQLFLNFLELFGIQPSSPPRYLCRGRTIPLVGLTPNVWISFQNKIKMQK